MSFKLDVYDFTFDVAGIVRINSEQSEPVPGGPFGSGNKKALEWFMDKATEFGFKATNDDGYSAFADYGTGREIIGILGHLDIVPAGTGWKHLPFDMSETQDGILYGRGVSDDKGPVVAALYAMKKLKENNIKLKHRVRLIVGFNEESGSECIKHYKLSHEIPVVSFTPDADFPVVASEKGILHFTVSIPAADDIADFYCGERANIVPNFARVIIKSNSETAEKLRKADKIYGKDFTVTETQDGMVIEARGVAAHGASPEKGDNAAAKLFAFLAELNGSETYNYLARLSSKEGPSFLKIDKEDKSGKLTMNVGMVRKENNRLVLTIDVRRPYSVDSGSIIAAVKESFHGLSVNVLADTEALFMEDDNLLVKSLLDVYREYTGDYESAPLRIGGGTYAKELPNCVGFGACFPGMDTKMHEPDEFYPKDKLCSLIDIYYNAIIKLDQVF